MTNSNQHTHFEGVNGPQLLKEHAYDTRTLDTAGIAVDMVDGFSYSEYDYTRTPLSRACRRTTNKVLYPDGVFSPGGALALGNATSSVYSPEKRHTRSKEAVTCTWGGGRGLE